MSVSPLTQTAFLPPFYKAILDRDLVRAEELLREGSDVNEVNNNLITGLMCVSGSRPDLEAARFLIAHDADVNLTDNSGDTALMGAARFGKREVVELLVGAGADTEIEN